MKKIICLFVICLLSFVNIHAKEYKINDMMIDIDDNWIVISRDNYKNNEFLKSLGLTEKEYEEFFKENDLYLNAYKHDAEMITEELSIYYEKNEDIVNLTNYDEDFITKESKKVVDEIKLLSSVGNDFKLLDNGYYANDNYKYLWLHYINEGNYYYFYQTAVNGQTYLVMYGTVDEITEESTKDFRTNILDKVKYNQDNSLKERKKSNSFLGKIFSDEKNVTVITTIVFLIIFTIITKLNGRRIEKKELKNKDDEFWDKGNEK